MTVLGHSYRPRQLFPGIEFVILKWRRIIYNGIYNNTQAYETPPVPRRVCQALTVLGLSRGKLNANVNCTRPLIDQTLLTTVTGTAMRNRCSSIIRISYWRLHIWWQLKNYVEITYIYGMSQNKTIFRGWWSHDWRILECVEQQVANMAPLRRIKELMLR